MGMSAPQTRFSLPGGSTTVASSGYNGATSGGFKDFMADRKNRSTNKFKTRDFQPKTIDHMSKNYKLLDNMKNYDLEKSKRLVEAVYTDLGS